MEFLVIIVAVAVVFVLRFHPPPRHPLDQTMRLADIRSGDIVLFETAGARRSLLESAATSFSHVGIVVDGGSRILEAHGPEVTGTPGTFTYDLKNRVSTYKGAIWIARYPRQQVPPTILPARYVGIPYDSWYLRTFVFGRRGASIIFCSELVARVLRDDLGMRSNRTPHRTTPDDLATVYDPDGPFRLLL